MDEVDHLIQENSAEYSIHKDQHSITAHGTAEQGSIQINGAGLLACSPGRPAGQESLHQSPRQFL